ncbi:N-acetylmuramoyl-L-alanine amidase, partial [candidate division WOR-3 bacterium]|nr:N-acetylmuramoyl-L-alanine amidase [candidate division WOR-3 bacterium]
MSRRMTPETARAVARGWSAADLRPDELVDDAWIAANTTPGKAPSAVRAIGGRMLSAVRTIGVDPLDGAEPADLSGLLPKLPRPIRRALIQKGGLTRDQMRRIAARTGYPYVEAWSSRNQGSMRGVWGAMIHHTGTSWAAAGDYPTLKVVRDGRSDLQNSLCGFGLGRSGTIYLISEKLSWHAGAGNHNGMTDGNGYTVGIEAESDGKNWTDAERDAYPRLVASILVEIGQDDRYTTRHATYALPKGRKTDASGLDMDLFWKQVYAYLANPAAIHKDFGRVVPPS